MIRTLLIAIALLISVPTSDQLHKLYDDGNYPELLKQLRIVLEEKDQTHVDRFDLFKLKGEALLHMKSDLQAADAFRDAAKASKSEDEASLARATEALLRQTHAGSYTPRSHRPSSAASQPVASIDVLATDSRKRAFAAMLEDELDAKSHQIDSAKKATSLPPIVSIAPTLGTLQDLEHAATGSNEKTGAMAKAVGDRARELVKPTLSKMTQRVDELDKKASGQARSTGKGSSKQRGHRGLTTPEMDELSEIASTCDDISKGLTDLGKKLGTGGGDFAAEVNSAQQAKKSAEEAMKNYGPKTGAGN
jgi:hypothetical protein